MKVSNCYYIIPTHAIGGAEKRFIELSCFLHRHEKRFHFHLIISKQLHAAILENNEMAALLADGPQVISYDLDENVPVKRFQQNLYEFVCRYAGPDDILHYILLFPGLCFPLKHKKTVFSLTESSLENVNFNGKAMYLLNALRARIVDVLDPAVHNKIRKYLFFKQKRILLTPGSFADTNTFMPAAAGKKANHFVFLGRFFFVKQVVELLQTLPDVCSKLNDAGINNYKFIFIGYGQLEEKMKNILSQPGFNALPVEMIKTGRPQDILSKSKVFFSVQLRNNYPSKSLLEAMSAGNIPLVTDVGDTRRIAAPEFSYYVPENFTAADISNSLLKILSLDEKVLQQKMQASRKFVIDNFSIAASAKYYAGIYDQLGRK